MTDTTAETVNSPTSNTPLLEAPPTARTPGSAIAAFLLGITGLPGIVLGHVALVRIKRSPVKLNGKIFAIAGIVLGWVSLITIVLFTGLIALGIKATESMNSVPDEKVIETASALKAAIGAYHDEYGKYPFSEDNAGAIESNSELMSILTAETESDANTNGTIFFTDTESIFDNLFSEPAGGLEKNENGNIELLDPFGNFYQVKLNTQSSLRKGDWRSEISVWSLGKDGADGTEDDLMDIVPGSVEIEVDVDTE